MKDVFSIVPIAIFLFERRYYNTIKDFLRDPSKMVKDYSLGKRKYYAPPLQFFYFLATVKLILSTFVDKASESGFEIEESEEIPGSIYHGLDWVLMVLPQALAKYSNFIDLGLPVIFGLVVFIFYKKIFNLAESFVFSFILIGLALKLTSILLFPFTSDLMAYFIKPSIIIGILLYVFWKLGERKVLNSFLGVITSVLSLVLFVVVLLLITLSLYPFFN